jgi:hypothetical protein
MVTTQFLQKINCLRNVRTTHPNQAAISSKTSSLQTYHPNLSVQEAATKKWPKTTRILRIFFSLRPKNPLLSIEPLCVPSEIIYSDDGVNSTKVQATPLRYWFSNWALCYSRHWLRWSLHSKREAQPKKQTFAQKTFLYCVEISRGRSVSDRPGEVNLQSE